MHHPPLVQVSRVFTASQRAWTYRKAILPHRLRIQLCPLDDLTILPPHIDILTLDKVITNDVRDSPSDQQPRDIGRHLNTSTDLSQLCCSFQHCDLTSCSGKGDSSRQTSQPSAADADMELLSLCL